MNRLALTLSLLLILNFSLKAQDNHAPNANASNPDASAVLATVTNYIEGMKSRGARFVFASDHSISPNTRYESFCYGLQVYREHMMY